MLKALCIIYFTTVHVVSLSGYSNANQAGDPTDRRSTTHYCFYLGDFLVFWCIKKQPVVSRSNTESEYRTVADATSEVLWLFWLLVDMGAPQNFATILQCYLVCSQ